MSPLTGPIELAPLPAAGVSIPQHGKSAGQVTLRWLLGQPRTVVIPKTARPERLAANLDVLDFDLEPGDVQRIDALGATRQRFFDPPWQSYAWDER